MAVATSSRLRSIIRFRVSGLTLFSVLSRFSFFSFPIRLVAGMKVHTLASYSQLNASDSHTLR